MTTPHLDRDPVGTTYLAPDGATYRLARYEVPFDLAGSDNEHEEPVYHYWGPAGGAAGGITSLPAGCVRVVLPTPDRPAIGSLFVTGDGTAYRLRDYRTDWAAEPFTGDHTVPSYTVMLPTGASTNADSLPSDARLVWAPEPGATPGRSPQVNPALPGEQEEQARLKAHLADRHACSFDEHTADDLATLRANHEHEHDGPGTIRNHPREQVDSAAYPAKDTP